MNIYNNEGVKNMKKLEIKIGNNCIFQIVDDNTSDLLPVGYVKKSWKNGFIFKKGTLDCFK